MKKKSRLLALKLAAILEEYSGVEVREAIEILKGCGHNGDLLNYLGAPLSNVSRKSNRAQSSVSRTISGESENLPRYLLNLKDSEPEKFNILSEFDQILRAGDLFTSNSDLSSFGETLSKSFRRRKTRRESIAAIMNILSKKNLDEIRSLVELAVSSKNSKNGSSYQNLANFLIKGKDQGA